jgi:hypothetical protein
MTAINAAPRNVRDAPRLVGRRLAVLQTRSTRAVSFAARPLVPQIA